MRPEPCKVQGSPAFNVVQGGVRIEKTQERPGVVAHEEFGIKGGFVGAVTPKA
jgi:hypothetical protein